MQQGQGNPEDTDITKVAACSDATFQCIVYKSSYFKMPLRPFGIPSLLGGLWNTSSDPGPGESTSMLPSHAISIQPSQSPRQISPTYQVHNEAKERSPIASFPPNIQIPLCFSHNDDPPIATGSKAITTAGISTVSSSMDVDCPFTQPEDNSLKDDEDILGLSTYPLSSGHWLGTLHVAAQNGHSHIVRLLLEQNLDCDKKDSDGLTPLHYAILGGFDDIVLLLLEHGAYAGHVSGQRRNALHLAILARRQSILVQLLERCSDCQSMANSYDSSGMTPLHMAIDMGFEAGVELLLKYGADPNYKVMKL